MPIEIVPTGDFAKSLKQISKKYKGIKGDFARLSGQLRENPTMGTILATIFTKSDLQSRETIKVNLVVQEL
jgi:hypothetical protein